jgi:hypothetical protein
MQSACKAVCMSFDGDDICSASYALPCMPFRREITGAAGVGIGTFSRYRQFLQGSLGSHGRHAPVETVAAISFQGLEDRIIRDPRGRLAVVFFNAPYQAGRRESVSKRFAEIRHARGACRAAFEWNADTTTAAAPSRRLRRSPHLTL